MLVVLVPMSGDVSGELAPLVGDEGGSRENRGCGIGSLFRGDTSSFSTVYD